MTFRIQSNVVNLLDNASISANATSTTEWWDTSGWQNKKVIWECDSTGTPSITITAQISPLGYYEMNNLTASTEYYYSATIASSVTSKVMVEYDEDDVPELGKAWRSVRFTVANASGAGAVTGGYLRLTGES